MTQDRLFTAISLMNFWIGVAAVAPVSAQSDLRALDGLVVVDGDKKSVAPVIALNDAFTPAVALSVGDMVVVLQVKPDGFRALGGDLFFQTDDCTGQAFLGSEAVAEVVPKATIRSPGSTIYVPDPTGTPNGVATNSSLTEDGECTTHLDQRDKVPALQLIDVTERFAPPFAVVPKPPTAEPCCADCNRDGAVEVDELITGVGNALDGCASP